MQRSKISTSGRIPFGRFDIDTIDLAKHIPEGARRPAVQWGNFISDVDMFDNDFFGISTAEAQCMDPNQKLVLETIASACYDAGMDLDGCSDSAQDGRLTGVFIGMSNVDFVNVDVLKYVTPYYDDVNERILYQEVEIFTKPKQLVWTARRELTVTCF